MATISPPDALGSLCAKVDVRAPTLCRRFQHRGELLSAVTLVTIDSITELLDAAA
ncbi:MAG: hypothetical protein L0H59_03830 [Tomitella sp.]|nr:hypothetical protein [Tomitella sp.]